MNTGERGIDCGWLYKLCYWETHFYFIDKETEDLWCKWVKLLRFRDLPKVTHLVSSKGGINMLLCDVPFLPFPPCYFLFCAEMLSSAPLNRQELELPS